jgi:hypothetical protein
MLNSILDKEFRRSKRSLTEKDVELPTPAKRFHFNEDTPATGSSTSSTGETSEESSPEVGLSINSHNDDLRQSKRAIQAVLTCFGTSLLRAADQLRSPGRDRSESSTSS